MKTAILLLALLFVGCDSIDQAAAKNQKDLPSNPDAAEQAEQSRKQTEAEQMRQKGGRDD